MTNRSVAAALLAATLGCTAAKPAYLGTWVPDQSRTDVSQVTWTYEVVDSITYQVSVDNQSFLMKLDGSETESPWGGTFSSRQLDPNSWENIFRVDGQAVSTDTTWLSEDGNTLNSRSHQVNPDGGTTASEMTMTRTSGGPGLAGTWQASSVGGNMLAEVSIAAAGDSGLDLSFEGMGATCSPNFDGSDSKATSPVFDDGWTCSISTGSDHDLTLTWKRQGEPRYAVAYSVSANGDTLTEVSSAVGAEESVTVVYTKKQP